VKAGATLRQVRIGDIDRLGHDLWMHNGSLNYRFRNGEPNQVTLTDAPWNFEESVRDLALYAQDQWTMKRFTLNAGIRYSAAKAWTPEQVLGAGFFVPERRFAPVDNIPHYRNLSPRIGMAYDLFGTGRTAVKASLGHYPDRVIQASANPAVNLTRTTSRNWGDTNRNYRPDCDLLNPVANGECGAWSNLNFGKANAETRYAEDAQSGFNDQFHNWQGVGVVPTRAAPRSRIECRLLPYVVRRVSCCRQSVDNRLRLRPVLHHGADRQPVAEQRTAVVWIL
jgi:hypothetical protein